MMHAAVIPTGVEESRGVTVKRGHNHSYSFVAVPEATPRDSSTSLGMTVLRSGEPPTVLARLRLKTATAQRSRAAQAGRER